MTFFIYNSAGSFVSTGFKKLSENGNFESWFSSGDFFTIFHAVEYQSNVRKNLVRYLGMKHHPKLWFTNGSQNFWWWSSRRRRLQAPLLRKTIWLVYINYFFTGSYWWSQKNNINSLYIIKDGWGSSNQH